MSAVLYLFGSGGAFYLAAVMVLGGFWLRECSLRPALNRVATFLIDIGLVIAVLSAAPLPYAVYALAIGSTIVWLVREKREKLRQPRGNRGLAILRAIVVGSWLIAVACDLPYVFTPGVTVKRGSEVGVIGDSITAGLGDRIVTWPKLLADQINCPVYDCSAAGADAHSALKLIDQLPELASVVIVEIGGNDLLGTTTSTQFAHDLDKLLALVAPQADAVLMFELPLPPLCNEYGRIQRRLAAKHHVRLIPKRVLIGVLATQANTSDTIHLSQSGQQSLAEAVERMLVVRDAE